ncbi:MAG: 50S ribosomal protein L29 [Chitinophagaceae bacterium]|jgi:large subunit ribosomal protein L29|nr:50S ribosomal protein L29 [Chitinophagaceae bacterium]NCW88443.1 50S ribosomal protein L29 [Chitinophagia bacterium]NBY25079.1 50S ribosomal protein L29 [Chitinophagaceae bacterium]NDB52615.1 50S ribosomal protein L29 [Chitinophagaceae bacterium]NDE78236.1 50S ribosomal protein L29 [Chitinophagaceae bacterium]
MSKKTEFAKTLQGMNEQDLRARLADDQQRLKKMEFAHAISPLENPMSIRSLRRDIARLKTAIKSKQQQA